MQYFFVENQAFSGQILEDTDGNIWKVFSCVDYNWFRNTDTNPNKFILVCKLIGKNDVSIEQ